MLARVTRSSAGPGPGTGMPRYDEQFDRWDEMVRRDQFIMCGLLFTGLIGAPLLALALALGLVLTLVLTLATHSLTHSLSLSRSERVARVESALVLPLVPLLRGCDWGRSRHLGLQQRVDRCLCVVVAHVAHHARLVPLALVTLRGYPLLPFPCSLALRSSLS